MATRAERTSGPSSPCPPRGLSTAANKQIIKVNRLYR